MVFATIRPALVRIFDLASPSYPGVGARHRRGEERHGEDRHTDFPSSFLSRAEPCDSEHWQDVDPERPKRRKSMRVRSRVLAACTPAAAVLLVLALLAPSPARAQRRAPPAPPPPPPGPSIVTTRGECVRLCIDIPKRHRCIRCVEEGRRFDRQGTGWGYCYPKPAPEPVRMVITIRRECVDRINHLEVRGRCIECVDHGGRFFFETGRPGLCKMPEPAPPPPPPPEAPSLTVGDCHAKAPPPPRLRRCIACVRNGGKFYHQGWRCEMPAAPPPPPPPAPVFLNHPHECNHASLDRGQRHACKECTRSGGRYTLDGVCHR
jgi:hypothetical protein